MLQIFRSVDKKIVWRKIVVSISKENIFSTIIHGTLHIIMVCDCNSYNGVDIIHLVDTIFAKMYLKILGDNLFKTDRILGKKYNFAYNRIYCSQMTSL